MNKDVATKGEEFETMILDIKKDISEMSRDIMRISLNTKELHGYASKIERNVNGIYSTANIISFGLGIIFVLGAIALNHFW